MNMLYSSARTITVGEEDAIDVEYVSLNEETNVATKIKPIKSPDPSSEERRKKLYIRLCEVLILTPVMLVIIGLLSLPTVFYVLPPNYTVSIIIITRSM